MGSAVFDKSDSSELYLYQDADSAPANYTVAFLQAPSITTFPTSISLADSWTDGGGLYLFLNNLPVDQASFVAAVRNYQASPALANARFLWIANPSDNASLWQTQYLPVKPGSVTGTWQVAGATRVTLRNYVLTIAAGCAIALASGGNTGFAITRNQPTDFTFSSGTGAALTGIGDTLALPMAGALIGCYGFALTIAQGANAAPATEMGRLDIGLKYFYDTPGWETYGYLTNLHYPVFSPAAAPILLWPSLDPINSGNGDRSYFSFYNPDGSTPGGVASYLKTWVGRAVNLQPKVGGNAKLVFLPRPSDKGGSAQAPYYLAPSGQFVLQIPPLTGSEAGQGPADESVSATRLLCGSSPAEYLGYLAPANPDTVANILYFVPGQNAYAPNFKPAGRGGGIATLGGNGGLEDAATTSYVALQASGGPTSINYYSQPASSLFYDPPPTPVTADDDFLDYAEIISQVLPAVVPSDPAAGAFPMVALAGLDGFSDADTAVLFENQSLSPARRNAIQALANGGSNSGTAAVTTRNATTRQGMLGTFDITSPTVVAMTQVTLARTERGAKQLILAGAGGGNVTGTLRDALQSNELFMVLSDQAAFEQNGSFLDSVLTIANIPFDLAPSTWAANGTIIVYKYAGDSIENLAHDLSAWAYPAQFSQSGLTQARLLAIIESIKAKHAAGEQDYDQVYKAVTSPGWNGILAFNTAVSLAEIPGQLAGLSAGIDASAFKAHHLGIDISPMDVEQGVLTMKDSALFGLIDYQDPTAFQGQTAIYDFKVKVLKILFGNSEIKTFSAKIDLLVNQWFGINAKLKSPNGEPNLDFQNIVELDGFYQRQAAGDTLVFVSAKDLVFRMESEVMDEVEITHAQFITVTPDAVADETGQKAMRTRFIFAGTVRFKEVSDFDALSFGNSEDGQIEGGLRFSNLAIHMDFNQDENTGAVSYRVFRLDAGNLALDLSASRARVQSLYSHFPLKFKAFIQGENGTNPMTMGYMACATPISETELSFPWYGLVYELNLGTVGALAGSAGFTATLIVAWSPGAGLPLYTGLQLPGTSPHSLSFSIQGLLNISIDDFRFQTSRTPQGNTSYTLVFSNLGLRVFGIKLPPSAYVDFVLFGNPEPGRRAASLGWYAAYVNQD